MRYCYSPFTDEDIGSVGNSACPQSKKKNARVVFPLRMLNSRFFLLNHCGSSTSTSQAREGAESTKKLQQTHWNVRPCVSSLGVHRVTELIAEVLSVNGMEPISLGISADRETA